MARVTISRQWGDDGDNLRVSIETSFSYPDVLAETKRVALDTYAEALAATIAAEADEERE